MQSEFIYAYYIGQFFLFHCIKRGYCLYLNQNYFIVFFGAAAKKNNKEMDFYERH